MDFMFSPILESTQPAFNAGDNILTINYTIPDRVSVNQIKHLGIKIIEQNTNQSVIDSELWPDGIIYIDFDANSDIGRSRKVSINQLNLIKKTWEAGAYYKIQMRFGSGPLDDNFPSLSSIIDENGKIIKENVRDLQSFINWKDDYKTKYQFSEWSTVMLTKAITPPQIELANEMNKTASSLIITSNLGTERSSTPLFEGLYNTMETEPITHYRFQLYNLNDEDNRKLIEDSQWQTHNLSDDLLFANNYSNNENDINGGDKYRFKTNLIYDVNNPTKYGVVYSVRTLNLYEKSTPYYRFTILETATENLPEWLTFEFIPDNEEGLVELILGANNGKNFQLSGNYIISRTSEKSNYQLWEDIKIFAWAGEDFNATGKIIFKDYTIESGINYKYAISLQNIYQIRSNKTLASIKGDKTKEKALVNFDYCYLYDNGVQLKLKYDNKMSSFKRTTLSNKQETLGSKYPVIMRHGSANYGEFPITGLLSLHSDEAQNFFQLKEDGYYYYDELVIPIDKLEVYGTHRRKNKNEYIPLYHSFGTNLTHDNTFIERIFREKAEAFLNDGKYKLFKSPTEGNMIIGLVNISLTPNEQLSRMIYSFSATGYEVLENTYDNLVDYGIQELGEFINEDEVIEYTGGQISDLNIGGKDKIIDGLYTYYNSWEDIELKSYISNIIDNIEADSIEDKAFKYILQNIETISFEPMPDANYQDEINYLDSKIQAFKAAPDPELMAEYEEDQINLQRLKSIVTRQRIYQPTSKIGIQITNVNGTPQDIYLGYNQIYYLSDLTNDQEQFTIKILPIEIEGVKYYPPIICNYTASMKLINNTEYVVNNVISANSWGQIDGIFTTNQDYYNMNMAMINNNTQEGFVSPLNIYNTLDITKIITNLIRKQATELINKDDEDYFNAWDENEKAYYNAEEKEKKNYLRILGYDFIDIEIDKFNQLTIKGVSQEYQPVIGPTHRYVLKYTDINNVQQILLHKPAHCIINFNAQCSIEQRGEVNQ